MDDLQEARSAPQAKVSSKYSPNQTLNDYGEKMLWNALELLLKATELGRMEGADSGLVQDYLVPAPLRSTHENRSPETEEYRKQSQSLSQNTQTEGRQPGSFRMINQFMILHRQPLSKGKNLGMPFRVRRLEALCEPEGLSEAEASPPMWPSQRIPKQRRPAA